MFGKRDMMKDLGTVQKWRSKMASPPKWQFWPFLPLSLLVTYISYFPPSLPPPVTDQRVTNVFFSIDNPEMYFRRLCWVIMNFCHHNYPLFRKISHGLKVRETRTLTDKAKMVLDFFWGEDVTISRYLPPSLVTLCHWNFPILATSLPPPSGDVIFEWPLTGSIMITHIKSAFTSLRWSDRGYGMKIFTCKG